MAFVPRKVPRVYVNLYKGSKRCAYWVADASGIESFTDMDPSWYSLAKDPFGPLEAQDYAGSLLMAIGLGKAQDLEGIRKKARDKATMESALDFRRQVVLHDDRIELSKHIAEFLKPRPDMERVIVGLGKIERLCQEQIPVPGSKTEKYDNICWLENVEMVCDQCLTKIYEFSKSRGTATGVAYSGGLSKSASNLLNQMQSDVDSKPESKPETNEMRTRKNTVKDQIAHTENSYTGIVSKSGGPQIFIFNDEYELVWDENGLGAQEYGSVWTPKHSQEMYKKVGDALSNSRQRPESAAILVHLNPGWSSPLQ